MNRTFSTVVAACVIATLAVGAAAQTPEETQSVVTLRVTAAAPARPALKHALLHDRAEMRPGDAAPLYFTATLLAAQARAAGAGAAAAARAPGSGPPAAGAGENERLDRYLSADAAELERDRADAQALVVRYDSALHQVELATHRDSCRWELSIREDGPNTLLPQLPELRTLARLLSLRARLQILDRRYDDAAATLRTGMTLARHLGEQAVLVQSVFAAGVAELMLERAAELAGSPGAPNLYWPLSALPQPFVDPVAPMQWERSFVGFAVPDLARAARGELPPEQWQAVWRSVRALATSNRAADDRAWDADAVTSAVLAAKAYPAAKRSLIASGVPAERVGALPVAYVVGTYQFRRYQEWSDELWKGFVLPYPQGAGVISRAMRDMDRSEVEEGANPFTALLPALNLTRLRLAQVDRSIAALRVVEAVRAYAAENDGRLPDSLDDVKGLPLPSDPVSGKPFRFERTPDGAVLRAPRVPAEQTSPSPRFEITVTR